MRRFELTDDLRTGLADIDDDHRALLELGNKIIDFSMIKKQDKAVFEQALTFLESYVIYHFAAEEYAMFENGYPGFQRHSRWHEQFRGEVSRYGGRARMEGASRALILEISFMIETWLLEHLRIMDRDFARFLQQKLGNAACLPTVHTLKTAGKLPENFDQRLMQGMRM